MPSQKGGATLGATTFRCPRRLLRKGRPRVDPRRVKSGSRGANFHLAKTECNATKDFSRDDRHALLVDRVGRLRLAAPGLRRAGFRSLATTSRVRGACSLISTGPAIGSRWARWRWTPAWRSGFTSTSAQTPLSAYPCDVSVSPSSPVARLYFQSLVPP